MKIEISIIEIKISTVEEEIFPSTSKILIFFHSYHKQKWESIVHLINISDTDINFMFVRVLSDL